MTKTLTLAALQTHYGMDLEDNIARTKDLIRQAAAAGAQVILPSELFQGPYFCIAQEERWFATAKPWREHPCVTALAPLAQELGVVLPISIFEREGPHYFNSLVMADADGSLMGVYRKSHIPDGPGYQEKYYFRPGDTGFKVWDTRHGRIGVGICWDQWYPEAARAMALMGAQALLYPTAIGSEPHDASLDTALPWRRAMQGHAVSNVIPVVGANRIGFEPWDGYPNGGQQFYGSSFIADHRGDLIGDMGRDEEGIVTATVDLDFLDTHRAAWGFFRDRRPELYGALSSGRPA
ncbi:N-carbamoylputrescine amidase [Caulobacter sp. SLTY]|uniref:N-carbamoylputrescine amidase n=1 Tax=Caulobacter sp. SLTY TaxID=2683262 RepID=UPI00141358A2|nr:N-carbamoylputrescine amidase [Caulobacter sp. SLTY]NBB16735.1 N-carbamoylputrescine amidase [Caulobacter sp. SLTY]NBB16765.1 N-carbamoylputrescine amidase [Caulobacter sp. SLTY]